MDNKMTGCIALIRLEGMALLYSEELQKATVIPESMIPANEIIEKSFFDKRSYL